MIFLQQVIRCLLIEPNPESALNEEAGKLLLEAYDDYHSRAKMMTEIHAMVIITKLFNLVKKIVIMLFNLVKKIVL